MIHTINLSIKDEIIDEIIDGNKVWIKNFLNSINFSLLVNFFNLDI